jgi:GNAT superfamily N-acetyltransferase
LHTAIEIRPFKDDLWPAMSRFLHDHWRANHPLCQKDLFYWQYGGFGPLAGPSACRVAVDGGRIVGFLGAIPGLYRLDGQDVPGVALALWVVIEEFRNSGLGVLLMREVQKQAAVAVCLGVNPKAAHYYTATGYKHLPALHRYVCPLQSQAYPDLLNGPADPQRIDAWAGQVARIAAPSLEPRPLDPAHLAALWVATQNRWRLTLSRTEQFWAWRYRDAVGFQYHWFGEPGQGGLVARFDRIRIADKPTLEGKQVLRIIEILPAGEHPGDVGDRGLSHVLAATLQWARCRGVVAADFQCSSSRLEGWLSAVGFRERSPGDPTTHLPEVFDPLRRTAAPINLMAKVPGRSAIDFDDIYCVKSDGDMDRAVTCQPGQVAGQK